MDEIAARVSHHRMQARTAASVVRGRVRFAPLKTFWLGGMASAGLIGGALTIERSAIVVFLVATGVVLLFGHSLGSHRKLIHDSYQCPKWLEYVFVWLGVQVGLSGPLGLLRQHELRDYAQRLPTCHDYLRHGRGFWRDGWWQLCCDLELEDPPTLTIESRIADDPFYRFLERSWHAQQLAPALLLLMWGGWSFVFWGTCARVTAGVVGHWLIGYFAHNDGGIHYEVRGAAVQGRNVRFASLLTMGESWHNNHHAYPGSARLGLFPGEWDPGWWVIALLNKAGLVWDIRLPASMPERVELEAVDPVASATPDVPATETATFTGLRTLWRTCLDARTLATRRGAHMEGPAANLPATLFRGLAGQNVMFRVQDTARRLTLDIDGIRFHGLPALCVSLCAGNATRRTLGLLLAPLAATLESTRQRLHVS
jgi:fatty-acid desaturase